MSGRTSARAWALIRQAVASSSISAGSLTARSSSTFLPNETSPLPVATRRQLRVSFNRHLVLPRSRPWPAGEGHLLRQPALDEAVDDQFQVRGVTLGGQGIPRVGGEHALAVGGQQQGGVGAGQPGEVADVRPVGNQDRVGVELPRPTAALAVGALRESPAYASVFPGRHSLSSGPPSVADIAGLRAAPACAAALWGLNSQ